MNLWRDMSDKIIIKTESVTKRFSAFTAVDNVNFQMQEGQTVGIIGPNGAGKTTFFNLLTGLFLPTEGKVYFFDKEITRLPPHKRTAMGIVRTFQLVSVFDSLSVLDNLVLSTVRTEKSHVSTRQFLFSSAHRPEGVKACWEALQMMDIEDKADAMTSELSYGEKRKLEIAIALSLNPRILLLDEPFAGLGDAEIGEVLSILNRVRKKFSLIIIEHKISRIVDMVERLSVMHEGKLIAEGNPREVLCNPLVREVYWGKEEGLTCSV